MNSSEGSNTLDGLRYSTINIVSVVVCLVAIILVFCLRLHKKVVYRLVLYQVMSSLVLALTEGSQSIFFNWNPKTYEQICVAVGWFVMFSLWMKLLFTMWATFHLFCFAVFHWNPKKLEVVYVATSLFLPALIASVPLTTHSYGFSPVGGCYIPAYNDAGNRTLYDAVIERFSLWSGPASFILLAESTAMVAMVITMIHRVYRRRTSLLQTMPITGGSRYKEALVQLLPLAIFPIMLLIFIVPVLVYDVYYCLITPTPDKGLVVSAYLFISLWSLFSGTVVIVHIFMSRLPGHCRSLWARHTKKIRKISYHSFDPTVGQESDQYVNSATSFHLPQCSIDTSG